MKNILIINRKGGVGKTLVADELAFALDAKNVPYCFYDLDGQGGTLHEPVEMDNADVSIIDTPGSLQGEMGEWVKDADVVIAIGSRMSDFATGSKRQLLFLCVQV